MSSHTYPAVLKQADNEVAYPGADPGQTAEWLEALDQVIQADGLQEASQLLQALLSRAAQAGYVASRGQREDQAPGRQVGLSTPGPNA